nr:hypothetical protein [Candidatus Saccharibacteria bacterium]NIV04455.1 hypothetical protein [Calditrichia bacterium]NIV73044.1 hypothetical protein [Calditrichia bacterium]NIW00311.1 hypothetical protein [Candidatus Saccharibacteria bacterium]NIW79097.1 hypothetical protein [Calditrichia bacterium]
MGKTKFWVFQIMMVALVSLVLGNPVFADQPAVKGKPNFTEDGLPEHANQNAHDNVGGAGTSTSSSSEGG